jgi:hypothetical protein
MAKTATSEARRAVAQLWIVQTTYFDGLAHALHAGEMLKLARVELGPDQFAAWVVAECAMSLELAMAYVRFAEGPMSADAVGLLVEAIASKFSES